MSEDIKMADVFDLPLSDDGADAHDENFNYVLECKSTVHAQYAARAINNHDNLTAEVKELKQSLANQAYRDVMLNKMNVERGGINLQLEGGACQLLANCFADQFRSSGATNYLEMSFESNDADIGELVVTMQRKDGKTPSELRSDAEAENKAMRSVLSLCASVLSKVDQTPLDEYYSSELNCEVFNAAKEAALKLGEGQ